MEFKKINFLTGLLPTLLTLMILLVAWPLHAKKAGPPIPACNGPESEPVVEIIRQGDFAGFDADDYAKKNYDDFIGTISNANFCRFWDGSYGSYKIPIRIAVPKDIVPEGKEEKACNLGRLAHVGLIEQMHPNYIGLTEILGIFGGEIHGWNDPVYDPLLDQGFMETWANLRAPFLFGEPDPDVGHGGGGVVYMGFQANNYGGQVDTLAAIPENESLGLHLQRPQDYAFLYRDVSKWLRQAKTPDNFINKTDKPLRPGFGFCSVSDVIGFGYSQTAGRLNAVLSNPRQLNSTWGSADPIFARGRVMDGALLAGVGGPGRNAIRGQDFSSSWCRDVTASQLSFSFTGPCFGPNEPSEGPMVIVQSETDVQGFVARRLISPGPDGLPEEVDHYKVHEINSTSHFDATYEPLPPIIAFDFELDPSVDTSSLTRQNPLDRSPVLRADLINLLDKIQNNIPLPDSKYMAAHFPVSQFEFGIVSLDPETGNGFGGISLPQAAAPLGLYRGIECHDVYTPNFDVNDAHHYAHPPMGSGDLRTGRANYLLESSPAFPIPGRMCGQGYAIQGLFTPYPVVDVALGSNYCGTLYPTRQTYLNRVTAAADQLIAERFLLPEEREEIIAAAQAEADKFPECVPPL